MSTAFRSFVIFALLLYITSIDSFSLSIIKRKIPIISRNVNYPSSYSKLLLYENDELPLNSADLAVDMPPIKKESFIKTFIRVIRDFDEDKEASRKLRRTVFTPADWTKHRSSSRYFRELTNLPHSGVIRGLIRQALIVAALSSVVVCYNVLVELKFFRSHNMPLLTFPALPFTLTSSSLGLLLVFRTNTAYARWNEARQNWSHISAKTFDVMRQCLAWLADKETVAKTVRYLVAFARSTKWHVTDRTNVKKLQDELNGVLTEEEVGEIVNSKAKPQFVLLCLTKLIARQSLIPNVQSHMDRGLIELGAALENCDRIYTTPIPLVYTRLTARFLLLWLMTFPLTLYNEFEMSKKWLVPIVIFMNSIFLLGIDDLGVQIEEPFSILPLANICYNIQSTAQMVLQTAGIDWFQGTPQHQAAIAAAAAAAAAAISAATAEAKANEENDSASTATAVSGTSAVVSTSSTMPAVSAAESQSVALAELAAEMNNEEELTFTIAPLRTQLASPSISSGSTTAINNMMSSRLSSDIISDDETNEDNQQIDQSIVDAEITSSLLHHQPPRGSDSLVISMAVENNIADNLDDSHEASTISDYIDEQSSPLIEPIT